MSQAREKLVTQVNSEILSAIRAIAEQEGRQIRGSRGGGPCRPDRKTKTGPTAHTGQGRLSRQS